MRTPVMLTFFLSYVQEKNGEIKIDRNRGIEGQKDRVRKIERGEKYRKQGGTG